MKLKSSNLPMGRMAAKLLSILILALVPANARAEATIYPIAYEIDAAFALDESAMSATARMDFAEPTVSSPIKFYLHGELRVQAVRLGDDEISFQEKTIYYPLTYNLIAREITADISNMDLSLGLSVTYEGPFNPSRARSMSDYMRIESEGVFLRGLGYSPWFPVFSADHINVPSADFIEVRITVPENFHAVFAGELIDRSVENGKARHIWRALETSPVNAQITARPFEVLEGSGVRVYAMPDEVSLAAGERIAEFAQSVVTIFRDLYRPAGEQQTTHVLQMPRFGDIASGTVVGISGESWTDFTSSSFGAQTLAHELVHDFVWVQTELSDPLYALIREGFPSYFHWPALELIAGGPDYDERFDILQAQYLAARESGADARGRPLPPEKPITEIAPDEIGFYKDRFVLSDRALLFMDYLRRQADADEFNRFVRDLLMRETLSEHTFNSTLEAHAAHLVADARIWLETTEYPNRFQRP